MTSLGVAFRRNPLCVLFLSELRRGMGRLFSVAGIIVLADAYFLTREVTMATMALLVLLPALVLPAVALYFGFEALRNEWKEHSHYLLLSLPVRAGTVLGAKLLASGVQMGFLGALAGGVAWWYLGHRVSVIAGARLADVPFPFWVKVLGATFVLLPLVNQSLAGMLAFLGGQTIGRGRWWMTGVAAASLLWILLWGLLRYGAWTPVWHLFSGLPDVDLGGYIRPVVRGPGAAQTCLPGECVLDLGWLVMNLVLLAILLGAAAALWDRKAEV